MFHTKARMHGHTDMKEDIVIKIRVMVVPEHRLGKAARGHRQHGRENRSYAHVIHNFMPARRLPQGKTCLENKPIKSNQN